MRRQTVGDLRRLLDELITILEREGASNYARSVADVRAYLDDPVGDREYAQARSSYRTLVQGKNTFSDYYIPRSDFTEQRRANQRLDELRDELWELFES